MTDILSLPISNEVAYCLGGIVSANEIKQSPDGRSAMLLPIRHNPGQVSSEEIQEHRKSIVKIISPCGGKVLQSSSKAFREWFPKNKDGFLVVFYTTSPIKYEDVLAYSRTKILGSPDSIKRAFLVGVFDGRCSWDKHARKITLDCPDSNGTALICDVLNCFSIHSDYNLARNRINGNNPRTPQLRISSKDISIFVKHIGLISSARTRILKDASLCGVLTQSESLLPGLTVILGLRSTKPHNRISPPAEEVTVQNRLADGKLQDEIARARISKHATKPNYSRKPKKKELVPAHLGVRGGYPRKQRVALNALEIADYKCEYNPAHQTFLRKRDSMPYTEPHHLVPLEYYEEFDVSLDIEENIVSLCSSCHNQLHYGKDIETVLKPLFESRKDLLAQAGIAITFGELLKMYK